MVASSHFNKPTALPRSTASKPFLEYGRLVYVPDEKQGYVLARLVDIGAETLSVELSDSDGNGVLKFPHSRVLSAEEDQSKDVDDNCALMHLNEGTLLHNCRQRYKRKQIYTYVANILISINPYEVIPHLYSNETIQRYKGRSLGALPPHIFAIADKAYRDMRRLKKSQSIVVSGESGAGKTETQKSILRYLCGSVVGSKESGPLEQKILETNPILESFGNSKTLRNNNSSRFGKFVEVHFDSKHQVAGGSVCHYLLEKTRVCHQQAGERNFHCFFQIFTDPAIAQQLRLTTPDHFNYLKNGCTQFFVSSAASQSKIPKAHLSKECLTKGCLRDSMVDDYEDFKRLSASLIDIGFTPTQREEIFRVLAGILHLGNMEFGDSNDDSRGGCKVLSTSMDHLNNAAVLLGLDVAPLKMGLTSRMMQPTKGGVKGTLIMVPLKRQEALAARDALSKAIYSRLFDRIVATINMCIPFGDKSAAYIGVLDIAGFESFISNSFEQLCINYCNESLQAFFNDRILREEQELYLKEGLNVPKIEYSDNRDCIELFDAKTSGLFACLDEEARLPTPSTHHFTETIHRLHKAHPRLEMLKRSHHQQKEMRDVEGFTVKHYAGDVCYDTPRFLEKNNDALHISLEMLMQESSNGLLQSLFNTSAANEESTGNGNGKAKTVGGKLNFISVGSKFRTQLATLVEKLKSTGTHFVRCVKPNGEMSPSKFDGGSILTQLKCAGMASVLNLMEKGYPSRTVFAVLYAMYQAMLPVQLARLDSRLFCRCLFYALGLNDNDYKFGMTKVFFRPGKFAEFDRLMHQDKDEMQRLIGKVQSWLMHIRWRKAQYGAWSCIKLTNKIKYRAAALIKLQSGTRGLIARRIHRPRIVALRSCLLIEKECICLCDIAAKLKDGSQWTTQLGEMKSELTGLIKGIKNNTLDASTVTEKCNQLKVRLNEYADKLKSDAKSDERKRLEAIEAETKQQKHQEEREQQKRFNQKRLLEERRQLEIHRQQLLLVEEEHKEKAVISINVLPKAPTTTIKSTEIETQTDAAATYYVPPDNNTATTSDLISWTYAKLRDAINTSTNIEFLEACRAEFHRRLKNYQEWCAANNNNNHSSATTTTTTDIIAPSVIITRRSNVNTRIDSRMQRYFRVPFAKAAQCNDYSFSKYHSSGFWYAHFDGQFIRRQMEVHPTKPPLFLISGRDDERMCELTLDETRLVYKKGAEIVCGDFEAVWEKLGGPPFTYRQ